MTALAQHSSASNEQYTPLDVLAAARKVMGGIDLDPATTKSVNTNRVKAGTYYTQKDDGLLKPWFGKVWLNPPGGKIKNKSSAAVWWAKLADEYLNGCVTEGIFLGFSIEILATAQDSLIWPGELPFCIPRKRLEFETETDEGVFVPGESPTHSNVIVYLPSNEEKIASFVAEFTKFGLVRV